MSSILKTFLALLLLVILGFAACGCETLRQNWPRTKEVMLEQGKEAIEDIGNNPTPGNAIAEGLEWLYLVISALAGFGAGVSTDGLRKRFAKKVNGPTDA